MNIPHPLCLLRTVWYSLRCGAHVDGCSYETDAEPTPENVHVTRCSVCGRYDVSWSWSAIQK